MSIIVNPSTGQNIINISDSIDNQINITTQDANNLNLLSDFTGQNIINVSGSIDNQINITTQDANNIYVLSNSSTSIETNNAVYITGDQNISGVKNFYLRPTVNGTGILLSGDITVQPEVTGVSGYLQQQITVLNNQTGDYVLKSQTGQFYASSNPSGFITGINNLVYTTGNQSISGNINISGNLRTKTSVQTASPSFTYTSGRLTGITYNNGVSKNLTYNADSTLNILTITYPDTSTIVKSFVWSSGVLQSINIV